MKWDALTVNSPLPVRPVSPWTPEQHVLLTEYAKDIAHAVAAGACLKLRGPAGWFSVVIDGRRIDR